MFVNNFTGARQQHVRHAVVRADRTAVVNRPAAAPLRAGKIGSIIGAKAEFARDDFLGEITFADEQRNDEDTRRKYAPQHAANGRLEFPEAFEHLREKLAAAQFIRVLIRRRGGIRVQRRAMADQHQRGVGGIAFSHARMFTPARPVRKQIAARDDLFPARRSRGTVKNREPNQSGRSAIKQRAPSSLGHREHPWSNRCRRGNQRAGYSAGLLNPPESR